MLDVFSFFRARGFEEDGRGSLVKWLTPDFYVRIGPEDGLWTPEEYDGNLELCLYIYLYAPLFGRVMTELFRAPESLAWAYLPRKLRKDEEGCLAYAMVRADLDEDCLENSTVTSTEGPLGFTALADGFDALKTDRAVFADMYGGLAKRLLAPIEGMWIYLFLARKTGLSPQEALASAEQRSEIRRARKTWHLERPMDREIIEYFNGYYDRLAAGRAN